jgi:hypothetical protein
MFTVPGEVEEDLTISSATSAIVEELRVVVECSGRIRPFVPLLGLNDHLLSFLSILASSVSQHVLYHSEPF